MPERDAICAPWLIREIKVLKPELLTHLARKPSVYWCFLPRRGSSAVECRGPRYKSVGCLTRLDPGTKHHQRDKRDEKDVLHSAGRNVPRAEQQSVHPRVVASFERSFHLASDAAPEEDSRPDDHDVEHDRGEHPRSQQRIAETNMAIP